MKVGKFFKKLFPCLSRDGEDSSPQTPPPSPLHQSEEQDKIIDTIVHDLVDEQRERFQEELNKERQRKLEELRLQEEQELERQRKEEQDKLEEFDRILREAEERQKREEEEEQKRLEELRRYEEEQAREEQRLLEEEKVKEEHIKNVVNTVFNRYKETYHDFYSLRPQPIHANFNEHMFKELCHKFTFNSEEELEACLKDYNLMQKQNKEAYNQLSRKRKAKCDTFNFYVFIDCNHHNSS